MIGGKLISQGSYGCVYYPQKKCNGRDSRNGKFVTKLVVDNEYSQNELRIGKIIKSIGPSHKTFFSLSTDARCNLNNVALKRMNTNGKCNVIKKHQERNKDIKFRLIKSVFVSNFTLRKRLFYQSNYSIILDTCIQVFSSMLSIIDMIQTKSIIHNDIRLDNIMMRGNRPIVIDFGISFTHGDMIQAASDKHKLKDIFFVFTPRHYILAPEIHYISFLLHERDLLSRSFYNWKEVTHQIRTNQSIARLLMDTQEDEDKYYQDMEQSFRRMENSSLENIVRQFKWKTFDMYMLCMIILDFLVEMKDSMLDSKRFTDFFSLLKEGIHPDPEKRYSIMEFKEKVKPLMINIHKNKGRKRKGKRLKESQKREIEKRSNILSVMRTMRA